MLGSLAMLLSMRWLVTSAGGTSVVDVLNLKMQKEAFLPALKNAFKGITITSFLFAIIWIVQFLSTGGIESKNLINVQMEAVIQSGNLPALTCTILGGGDLCPICEELLFEVCSMAGCGQECSGACRLVSGFIFAIYHVDPQMVPGLWAVGFGLALVYERTRTLWGSIMMHSMWNLWYAIVCLFLR
ncbi:MAG: CPBP family intramembrane glutamic endopeptidase [Cyanobacteriota/Melainabacteria group bacterium]